MEKNKLIECSVCLENNWLTHTPCNHPICLACLFKLTNDQCPLCRQPLLHSLPEVVKPYLKFNQKKNIFDIHDQNQFPDLNLHPFS